MDKVTKQKNPKRQAAGRKSHEKYMAKLKEDVLKNVGNDSSGSSTNTTNDTGNGGSNTTNDTTNGGINSSSSSTNSSSSSSSSGTNSSIGSTNAGSSSSSFVHIYGIGAIAVLALGVYIFIIPKYLKKTQPQNKSPEKILKSGEKYYNKWQHHHWM